MDCSLPGSLESTIFMLLQNFMSSSLLGGEGNGTPPQYSCLENPMDGGAWWAAVHGVAKSRTRLSDFTFTFHFHALEKEMAAHCSVLAWRIPGMGEPGGLPSMGSHRVGHDWSNLAAAAVSLDHLEIFSFPSKNVYYQKKAILPHILFSPTLLFCNSPSSSFTHSVFWLVRQVQSSSIQSPVSACSAQSQSMPKRIRKRTVITNISCDLST